MSPRKNFINKALLRTPKYPPKYVFISTFTSFGGFLFGMDTSIIGPVTVMSDYVLRFGTQSAVIHGVIVSSILIPAAVTSFVAGYVADLLGRPKCIAIGALIFGIGAALQAGAVSLSMFIVGRCIEGLGEGLYLGTLVVYICEITPPRKRGTLATGPQLLLTFGLLTGYFTCYGTDNIRSSLSWRTPFIILASLSIIFSMGSLVFLVPSPRWLALKGRHSEAAAAWEILQVDETDRENMEPEDHEHKVQGSEELSNASSQEKDLLQIGNSKQRKAKTQLLDAFSSDVRARTLLAIFIMGMQQLSGIDGVLYYAPLIFQQAGISSVQATFLASGVSAIVIVAATIPATLYADKWGRRSSMIFGGLSMGAAMLLIGSFYAAHAVHPGSGAVRWVVIVTVYVYIVLFCASWSVSAKVYAAEVQPQRTRASATNLAHGSNWITNFVVALTTPVLLDRSDSAAYFLWGGCLLLTAAVCLVCMTETKGRSLDDIEAAFRKKTMKVQAGKRFGSAKVAVAALDRV